MNPCPSHPANIYAKYLFLKTTGSTETVIIKTFPVSGKLGDILKIFPGQEKNMSEYTIPSLSTRAQQPQSAAGKWLFSGGSLDAQHAEHKTHPWYSVLWLTGVDYFSTLGYQPGIALLAAGAISPMATILLVIVTLLCALPVYSQVAARSYAGQGSIAMLENLLKGWWSKIFVLVLIGFAATDFVITMTLSAADAAQHAIENPFLHHYLEGHQIAITIGLLALLAIVFIKGFAEALGLAAAIAVPYLLLNAVVLIRGFIEIFSHPEMISNWQSAVWAHPKVSGSMPALLALTAFTFPKLALGLSGFETGVSVMPLVANGANKNEHEGEVEKPHQPPLGRIKNTRKLLTAAALIMSVLLIASSFVTSMLVKESDYQRGEKLRDAPSHFSRTNIWAADSVRCTTFLRS